MKIRDAHASINGSSEFFEMPSGGLDILSEDGRPLFGLRIKDNVLHLNAGHTAKINGVIYEETFVIKPLASNCVEIIKNKY